MNRILRGLVFGVCVMLSISLLSSCAGKPPADLKPDSGPALTETDEAPLRAAPFSEIVLDVPQRASQAVPVSDQPLLAPAVQVAMHERALERFFAPWKQVRASLSAKDISWGVRSLGSKRAMPKICSRIRRTGGRMSWPCRICLPIRLCVPRP